MIEIATLNRPVEELADRRKGMVGSTGRASVNDAVQHLVDVVLRDLLNGEPGPSFPNSRLRRRSVSRGASGLTLGIGLDEFVENCGKQAAFVLRASADLLSCGVDAPAQPD